MTNTSATGGYLVPDIVVPVPLEDDALDNFLHDVWVGITGLANELVFPRWQGDPPDLPDRTVNWLGAGIMNRRADTFASVIHQGATPTSNGSDLLQRHEILEIVCSFYGPNCQAYGALLRDGLDIAQNREQLYLAGMGLVGVDDLKRAPEIIKGAWYQRADLPLAIRREVRREYPVLNLVSAQATLYAPAAPDHVIDTLNGARS